jgi:hypothetical protein
MLPSRLPISVDTNIKRYRMSKATTPIPKLSEQVEKLLQFLNKEPDYPCVLVLTSFLDESLASLIGSRLVQCKATNDLLTGRLSTLGARTDASFCLGLITEGMHADLKCIAEIRNKFAHAHLGASFSELTISTLCKQLTLPHVAAYAGGNSHHSDPWHMATDGRNRFVTCGIMLANRLLVSGLGQTPLQKQTIGWEKTVM